MGHQGQLYLYIPLRVPVAEAVRFLHGQGDRLFLERQAINILRVTKRSKHSLIRRTASPGTSSPPTTTTQREKVYGVPTALLRPQKLIFQEHHLHRQLLPPPAPSKRASSASSPPSSPSAVNKGLMILDHLTFWEDSSPAAMIWNAFGYS